MAKKAIDDPWHYPGKGDFPLVGELVWVQALIAEAKKQGWRAVV